MLGVKSNIPASFLIICFIILYSDFVRNKGMSCFHFLNIFAFPIATLLFGSERITLTNIINMFPLSLVDYIYISLFFGNMYRYPVVYTLINATFHHLPLIFVKSNFSFLRLFIILVFLLVIKFYYDIILATRSSIDHVYDVFIIIITMVRAIMSINQKKLISKERSLCISFFAICDAIIHYKSVLTEISDIEQTSFIYIILIFLSYIIGVSIICNMEEISFLFLMVFNIECGFAFAMISIGHYNSNRFSNWLFAEYRTRNLIFLVHLFNTALVILLYLDSLRKVPVGPNASVEGIYTTQEPSNEQNSNEERHQRAVEYDVYTNTMEHDDEWQDSSIMWWLVDYIMSLFEVNIIYSLGLEAVDLIDKQLFYDYLWYYTLKLIIF